MKKVILENIFLIIPIALFTFLFLPFIDIPTCWDASTEHIFVDTLYKQGIQAYAQIPVAHPLFKPILAIISYKIGGYNSISYNSVGLIIGFIGIVGMYLLAKSLFGKAVGEMASILLATFPLFLANAVNNLNDYVVTSLLLISLYFYYKRKLILFIASISAAVFTKETAVLLPVCVFSLEAIANRRNIVKFEKKTLLRLVFLLTPIFLLYIWNQFTLRMGRTSFWSWNLTQDAYQTIFRNVITFNIFTKYTKAHILKVLFLNFHWIYWLILIIGMSAMLHKIKMRQIQEYIFQNGQKGKTLIVMFLFCVAYVFTVLTFQIPPTARYYLPLFPFLIIGVSYVINKYLIKVPLMIIILFSGLNFIGLFFSLDPFSQYLWGKQHMEGQNVYSKSIGDDELVYNLQYLFILKQRKNEINFQNAGEAKLCSFRE